MYLIQRVAPLGSRRLLSPQPRQRRPAGRQKQAVGPSAPPPPSFVQVALHLVHERAHRRGPHGGQTMPHGVNVGGAGALVLEGEADLGERGDGSTTDDGGDDGRRRRQRRRRRRRRPLRRISSLPLASPAAEDSRCLRCAFLSVDPDGEAAVRRAYWTSAPSEETTDSLNGSKGTRASVATVFQCLTSGRKTAGARATDGASAGNGPRAIGWVALASEAAVTAMTQKSARRASGLHRGSDVAWKPAAATPVATRQAPSALPARVSLLRISCAPTQQYGRLVATLSARSRGFQSHPGGPRGLTARRRVVAAAEAAIARGLSSAGAPGLPRTRSRRGTSAAGGLVGG